MPEGALFYQPDTIPWSDVISGSFSQWLFIIQNQPKREFPVQ